MELKRIKIIDFIKREVLLIVPYGIETTIGILPIEIYILF